MLKLQDKMTNALETMRVDYENIQVTIYLIISPFTLWFGDVMEGCWTCDQ